jgi:hypothetical protein
MEPAVQLTLSAEPDAHRPDDEERCAGCAARDPAKDPACPICGGDYDPATGRGIPF